MAEQSPKTIRIKWVRSGIGFTWRQKAIVRSLGLNKLNHTVVRPDTPQIRGIVAAVPHLLEIVDEPVAAAWAATAEYTVTPQAGERLESASAVAGEGTGQADESRDPTLEMKSTDMGHEKTSGSEESAPPQDEKE